MLNNLAHEFKIYIDYTKPVLLWAFGDMLGLLNVGLSNTALLVSLTYTSYKFYKEFKKDKNEINNNKKQ